MSSVNMTVNTSSDPTLKGVHEGGDKCPYDLNVFIHRMSAETFESRQLQTWYFIIDRGGLAEVHWETNKDQEDPSQKFTSLSLSSRIIEEYICRHSDTAYCSNDRPAS